MRMIQTRSAIIARRNKSMPGCNIFNFSLILSATKYASTILFLVYSNLRSYLPNLVVNPSGHCCGPAFNIDSKNKYDCKSLPFSLGKLNLGLIALSTSDAPDVNASTKIRKL